MARLVTHYEVLDKIGQGGMGVVYRAHDTVLGRLVALKLLHASELATAERRLRFLQEARAASALNHPNIVTIYETGSCDGADFIAMELVAGQSLDRVLNEKALPLPQALNYGMQIAAALSAAHAAGIVHRDLKPANTMITSDGRVKLLDFGLAKLMDTERVDPFGETGAAPANVLTVEGTVLGTAAYMSPEQAEGKFVDVRTDIFSFGSVFYEMLTGQMAFRGETRVSTFAAILREDPQPVSKIRPEVPAEVERVVRRCLRKEPARRFQTAADLKVALDELAEEEAHRKAPRPSLNAVLAAGETPLPEVVAEAGSHAPLRPAFAVAALAGIAAGLAALCFLTPMLKVVSKLPLENPPQVLEAKVRDIVRTLGYTERAANSTAGFHNEDGYLAYTEKRISGMEQWNQALSIPPYPVSFWYRQGPKPLIPEKITLSGSFSPEDISPSTPGTLSVNIGIDGRLLRFIDVPLQFEEPAGLKRVPDWSTLFTAAHLDLSAFAPMAPRAAPAITADTRQAWAGKSLERPDLPVRVEAGAFRGRVVYFEVLWPWSKPVPTPGDSPGPGSGNVLRMVADLALLTSAGLLARYNWKTGRGDLSGAWRVVLFFVSVNLLFWALGAHNDVRETTWPYPLVLLLAAYYAAVSGAVYLAFEPWVRRHSPERMIAWSRILTGRWRDPLVGKHILFGILAAMVVCLLTLLFAFVQLHSGGAPLHGSPDRGIGDLEDSVISSLMGFQFAVRGMVLYLAYGVLSGMGIFLMLFSIRVLLRSEWLAAIAVVAVLSVALTGNASHWKITVIYWIAVMGIFAFILLRLGLVALMITIFAANTATQTLITTDFTAWYGHGSFAAVLILSALALWSFYVSLGGRPLLNEKMLER